MSLTKKMQPKCDLFWLPCKIQNRDLVFLLCEVKGKSLTLLCFCEEEHYVIKTQEQIVLSIAKNAIILDS